MWKMELVRDLGAARDGDGKATNVMRRYMECTGKSKQQLYRIAKDNGYKPKTKRKRRCDLGTCCLTDEQIGYVAGRLHTSARQIKGVIIPVEKALEDAFDNGIIDRGSISVSRMQAILRERGLNAEALNVQEPHIEMRSLHPNHVHEWDVSVCIQYYLKGKQGLRIMDERKFYKNKWENFAKVKQKIYRYVLTDHFSHTIFIKYYIAKGETQDNLYDFLSAGWAGGKHKKLPFRGVPFFVLMDAGAANISKAITRLINRLDVKTPKALPSNAKRQGSVERAQEVVEKWFESELRFQPADSIETLNEWALDWCVWFNATKKHTRHKMTRTACWLQIKEEQLRELPAPEILHNLYAQPEKECLVYGDYSIKFNSERFRVKHIEGLIPHKSKVKAILRPYHWPEIGIVFNDVEYLASPIGTADGGFSADASVIGEEFKAMPESITQKGKKRIENRAYGEDRKKDDIPYAGSGTMGKQAAKVTYDFMPRKGTPMAFDKAGVEEKEIPITEFFKRLIGQGCSITPEMNKAIRAEYGKSISLTESARLIDLIESGDAYVLNGKLMMESQDDTFKAVANS
jgi:hypothetical protein